MSEKQADSLYFNPNGKIKILQTHLKIFYFFNMNVNFATGNENELVDFVA